MCGRFTLTSTPEELARRFGLSETPSCAPRYNVAPGQDVLAVRAVSGARRADPLRWGLVPSWADDVGQGDRPGGRPTRSEPEASEGGPPQRWGARMINARAETAAEKPAFREALRARRCIVPASGFYEWADRAGIRQPYWIGPIDGAPLGIAGIWERWRAPDGAWLESCALLTTAANARILPLHDRMPAILAPQTYADWLDPAARDVAALLRPLPAEALALHPVSTRVNRVEIDDPSCLARVPEPPRQPSLF